MTIAKIAAASNEMALAMILFCRPVKTILLSVLPP